MLETSLRKKQWSAEDYRKLPEGSLYQLINGELLMSAAPKKTHQEILGDLFSEIHHFVKEADTGTVYPAPFDVYFDERNVLQPDICFIASENSKNFRDDGYFYGSPDLVIEILSPSNAIEDFTRKFRAYEKFGVKEYFIVDPESKDVIAYSLTNGKYQEVYRESGIIISGVLHHEFHF